ncbi:MAG: FKBP-type peptidyl-prolyl cis-trans isomerase [Bacteroidota bacterium]
MDQAIHPIFQSRYLFLILISCVCVSCQSGTLTEQSPVTQLDSVSYALGMDIARFYQKQEVPLNSMLVYQGIDDILKEQETLLSEEQALKVLADFRMKQEEVQKLNQAKLAIENQARSEMFFRENREKEGVVVLASGLQYRVLNAGTGASPLPSNVVKVNYSGKLLEGTVFDNSATKGGPDEIKVEDTLPGLTEALLLMKPGAKWELYIPPHLAYGDTGFEQIIPPNSVLIYELELLEILR